MIHVDEKHYTEILRKASKWDALEKEWKAAKKVKEYQITTLNSIAHKHIDELR